MRDIYFILNQKYENLDKLKISLTSEGYITHFVTPSEVKDCNFPKMDNHSYIICDCIEGINLSHSADTGYIFYETKENANLNYGDCQCVLLSFEDVSPDFILKMYQRFNNIPWTIANTDRLFIKELSIEDIDRLYEIYDDPQINNYCHPLSKNRTEEREILLAYIDSMYHMMGFGMWNLISKENGEIIGRAGLNLRDGYDCVELGYLIDKSYRNKGYAFESCKEILKYAKEELGCNKINCFINADNKPSINLAKKLGFIFVTEEVIDNKLHYLFSYSTSTYPLN